MFILEQNKSFHQDQNKQTNKQTNNKTQTLQYS